MFYGRLFMWQNRSRKLVQLENVISVVVLSPILACCEFTKIMFMVNYGHIFVTSVAILPPHVAH
jgi:hypothetical protein